MVGFSLAKNFAGQRRHIPLATKQVTNQIEQWVAFTPIEIGMGILPV